MVLNLLTEEVARCSKYDIDEMRETLISVGRSFHVDYQKLYDELEAKFDDYYFPFPPDDLHLLEIVIPSITQSNSQETFYWNKREPEVKEDEDPELEFNLKYVIDEGGSENQIVRRYFESLRTSE